MQKIMLILKNLPGENNYRRLVVNQLKAINQLKNHRKPVNCLTLHIPEFLKIKKILMN
jgi:hypothetical protein